MSKWLPPLLCPIPKGHENNACDTYIHRTVSYANRTGRPFSSTSMLQVILQRQRDEKDPQFSVLPQPSAYFRLFKKRAKDKIKWKKHRKIKIEYLMFKPTGEYIGKNSTLKEAKRHLAMDEVTFIKTHKKVEVPIGSYVLKYINDPWNFDALHSRFNKPNIHNTAPVAVKRCKECPNKTSRQGICHCGFWSAIRDNTESKVWWSIHDRKMFDIRRKKVEQKVINIRVSLQDLFDN